MKSGSNTFNFIKSQVCKTVTIDFATTKYQTVANSDFIWPFLRPYMGGILNPKMVLTFPISCILALIFPIMIKYFSKCEGKGSSLKSQIKSLAKPNHRFAYLCLVNVKMY